MTRDSFAIVKIKKYTPKNTIAEAHKVIKLPHCILFIGLTNIMGIQMLVPLGKEKVVLYSEIAGMIVDIILNALLIPKMASTGAAIGTLAAEIAVFIVQYVALRGIISMENVSTIFMNIDTLNILGINISCNIRALVYYQNRLAMCFSFMCKNRPIQTRTYY